jgi:hypothetical protein
MRRKQAGYSPSSALYAVRVWLAVHRFDVWHIYWAVSHSFVRKGKHMRLAAQMRGGFYPAPTDAIAHAATFLRPPREPWTICDPCAGEGAAIKQLSDLLGCPQSLIYAIELDDSRAVKVRDTFHEAQVLAPASFFGCRSSPNSFSMIYLNPPFDDNYAGGRMEIQFLQTATHWLMPGGVMALVCPETVADEYSDVRRHFGIYYENCMIVPFPEEHRHFKEVIVFGHKRARPQVDRWASDGWDSVQAPLAKSYSTPKK